MKETPKTQQQVSCLLKKKTEEKLQEKKHQTRVFFFSFKIPLQRKAHNGGGGKLRRKRDLSSNKQTNKQTTQAKRGRTKERREQNARKSWPPLSPPLRFWCFPFRRNRRSVEEERGGAKEAPIIIRAFKQHERGGRFRGRVFR